MGEVSLEAVSRISDKTWLELPTLQHGGRKGSPQCKYDNWMCAHFHRPLRGSYHFLFLHFLCLAIHFLLVYNIASKISGFTSVRDEQTKTQYAYNNFGFVSYDDERAICEKTEYAMDQNLNGYIIWEISGDLMPDLSTPLLDATNDRLNKPNVRCDPTVPNDQVITQGPTQTPTPWPSMMKSQKPTPVSTASTPKPTRTPSPTPNDEVATIIPKDEDILFGGIRSFEIGESHCEVLNIFIVREHYVAAVVQEIANEGDENNELESEWFGLNEAPIDDGATFFIIVYHIPTSHEICRYPLPVARRTTYSFDCIGGRMAMNVSNMGFVMTGGDARNVGRVSMPTETVQMMPSPSGKQPRGKKKRLVSLATGRKKDGFARGMSLRG